MADNPGDIERRATEMRLMASFAEMLMADGVVLIYTWTLNKQTNAKMLTWGNGLLAKSILEWAYTETFAPELEGTIEEEEEDDEED